MFQRFVTRTLSPRAGLRAQVIVLCFCLIMPLASHGSGFGVVAHFAFAHEVVAGYSGDHGKSALHRGFASHRLPALLTPAPNLASILVLRSGSRSDDFTDTQFPLPWTAVDDVPCFPSLRIDPITWDMGTPSFLLPSAYGLVRFSIPPPALPVV